MRAAVRALGALCVVAALVGPGRTAHAQPPGYELAYVDGKTVTINAIDFNPRQTHLPSTAQADLYMVVYPSQPAGFGWQDLGLDPPQCNPCDHAGNGDTPDDYHDHVLDSMPSDPGHGEFRAPWHVYAVVPVYTGDPIHDAMVSLEYASYLPAKSEADVNRLLSDVLEDGSPVAVKVDTGICFICAVVSDHAGAAH